ncbi:MAG: ABC transporter permease [Lachnospiraceae bacterium]|nr:ABC transporter permease [Lachnospiraceae bacterium]
MKKKKKDWYGVIRVLAAVALAFIIATIIIAIVAEDPATALHKFFLGPFSTKRNFFNVIESMIPLVFAALAINIMHKSGLFSMAADSAFYMAGVTAASIAIGCKLPAGVHQVVIILAGALVGGLIGLIPVLIKKFCGANELVVSLMMGYLFFNFGYWLIREFFIDIANGSYSVKFEKTASLGKMIQGTNTHYGVLIMIVAVILVWILMDKSKFGRELKITGANRRFAKYAGINVGGVIVGSQFVGGAVAGAGGAVEMIGMYSKFEWIISVSYVWDGILINLLASTKPLFIPLAAFFISYIRVGATVMSRGGDVDAEIVSVIQGIIILLVASERFLYTMKKRQEEKEALENQLIEDKKAEE